MLRKDTFFHYQTPGGKHKGFSAIFSPVAETELPLTKNKHLVCWHAITVCNTNDKEFNKKFAREILRERQQELIEIRHIPSLLAALANQCGGKAYEEVSEEQFYYMLRGFV